MNLNTSDRIGQLGHVPDRPPKRDKSGEQLPVKKLDKCPRCYRVREFCICKLLPNKGRK